MTQHMRRITPRGAAIVLLGLILFVYLTRLVLLPFVIAGAIALAINPLTELIMRRTGLARAWVGAGLFLVILAFAAVPLWLWLPSLLESAASFAAHLEQLLEAALRRIIGARTVELLGVPANAAELARRAVAALRTWLGETRNALLLVGGSFAALMGAFLSLVLLLYFMTTGPQIGEGLLALVPPDQRGVARHIWGRLAPILRRYFAGLAVVVLFTSSAAYLGIGLALGLPDAAPLALATGVLELIPMLGPLASAVLVGMVALNAATGIGGVIAFLIYAIALRLSIDQLVGPIVLGRAAHIHPVLVIFCFLTGAALFGVIGVILAVPLALAIKIMLSELYGDPDPQAAAGGAARSGKPQGTCFRPPRAPALKGGTGGPQVPAARAGAAAKRHPVRRLLVDFLRRRLNAAAAFRLAFWDGDVLDIGGAPRITIRLTSPAVFGMMLRGDIAGLGDAYAKGLIDAEGSSDDIAAVGIAIAESIGRSRWIGRFATLLRHQARHSRRGDAADIAYHYDVSNAFYALWLDRSMVYSCAYFRSESETIDAAQENKLEHICRKLRLREGERFLDIGCGWGGLVFWAARRFGVKATGVTLSRQQYEFCTERIKSAGLATSVRILLQDYRDLEGQGCYDKIASVGMYEHVGIANLPIYFATIARLLAPGGMLLNHGIATNGANDRPVGPPGCDFIDRHVFPGGEIPHLSTVVRAMCRSNLEPVDIEDLRPHYALTLRHWVRRLEAEAETAILLGGMERYRLWRIYLAGMAQAFDRGWLGLAQVVAYKGRIDGMAERPWTREYMYVCAGLTDSRGFDAATNSGSAHPAP
jgi:cyclopropane-fatty-acyl-phospholipid synthase